MSEQGPGRVREAVTLAHVAERAGVGESTVSRVLRGEGAVSEKTRARVRAAVRELGYVPNRIAGTLASAGSKLVGIVVPSLANVVFADLLRGASGALEEEGFQPVIAVSEYDADREAAHVAGMLAWRPAALMLAGLEHADETRVLLAGGAARVVEVLDTDGEGMDIVVGFSNAAAGHASARHLLARGYRRFGYVGHDLVRDTRAAKRLKGFEAALAEAGVAPPEREVFSAPSSVELGRDGLERLLARARGLEAVYFSNDDMALGAYFLCLSRGVAVPERLALFGYNGLDVARLTPQPLATLRTPRVAVGAIAARLIGAGAPAQKVDVGFELVPGATA